MSCEFEKTWETYTKSWKTNNEQERINLFKRSLNPDCIYTDPLVKTTGIDELTTYMNDFHQQVPGGHFVTNYFLAHNNKSIAKWDMKNGDDEIIGHGISYGEYAKNGKLISMIGFYKV